MKEVGKSLSLAILAVVINSCFYNKEDLIIPGNEAPPDPTISTLIKENYVNRVYISVLGRKPVQSEYQQALLVLSQTQELSQASRSEFLQDVFGKPEYFDRLYELARVDLLNGADTLDVVRYIYIIHDQLDRDPGEQFRQILLYELERLERLQQIPSALKTNQIDVIEMHRRCLDNLLYDEINMGTENFVVSVFQNLLFRYPTADEQVEDNELENSKRMVEGFEAILFFNLGDSKTDFLDIFVSSSDYFEGQVRYLFNRFLFREPTSEEMTDFVLEYLNSRNYVDLQIQLLMSDEYIGI